MSIMDAAKAAAARPTYKELKAEVERLRAVLRAIMQLGGDDDLPEAWTLARAALEQPKP